MMIGHCLILRGGGSSGGLNADPRFPDDEIANRPIGWLLR